MTQRAVLLQALASTITDVNRVVGGFDSITASWRPSMSSWSSRDVVDHLVATEQLYRSAVSRALAEVRPTIKTRAKSTLPENYDSLDSLAVTFASEREQTLAALQAIGPGDWQRKVVDEANITMTLRYLIQQLVDHDIEHTNQLVEIQVKARRASAIERDAYIGQETYLDS